MQSITILPFETVKLTTPRQPGPQRSAQYSGFLALLSGRQKPPPTEQKRPDPPREAARQTPPAENIDRQNTSERATEQQQSRSFEEQQAADLQHSNEQQRKAEVARGKATRQDDAQTDSVKEHRGKVKSADQDSEDLSKQQLMRKIAKQIAVLKKQLGVKQDQQKNSADGEQPLSLEQLMVQLHALLQQLQKTEGAQKSDVKAGLRKLADQLKQMPQLKQSGEQLAAALNDGNISKMELDKLIETAVKQRNSTIKNSGGSTDDATGRQHGLEKQQQPKVEVKDLRGNEFRNLDRSGMEQKIEQARQHRQNNSSTATKTDGTQIDKNVEFDGAVQAKGDLQQQDQLARDGLFQSNRVQKGSGKNRTQANGGSSIADPKAVFNQIVKRARITHKSGMSEMKLQLNPRKLGNISMKLVLKDGQLSGSIQAASDGVRQLLKDNLGMLQQELRDAGMNLEQLTVAEENRSHLQSGNQNSNGSHGEQSGSTGKSGRITTQGLDGQTDSAGADTRPVHDGTVNLVA